ncbi:MAG: heme NO-binding domain-containing protein [Proteobacteria bacterium]|nr:heme NO-binding domain-containing protein [Pseudomonadota bacterium]
MKGIVFNELERMVTDTAGEALWDELIETTRLQTPHGIFLGPQTYPDEDFMALVAAASKALKIPLPQLVPAFGRYLLSHLVERFPIFVKPGMGAKSFLLTVEDTIHLEVQKLYADAVLPRFFYTDPGPDRLELTYESPRKLCMLLGGLIDGVAAYFKETVRYEHDTCVHRGDPSCHFVITFGPPDRTD